MIEKHPSVQVLNMFIIALCNSHFALSDDLEEAMLLYKDVLLTGRQRVAVLFIVLFTLDLISDVHSIEMNGLFNYGIDNIVASDIIVLLSLYLAQAILIVISPSLFLVLATIFFSLHGYLLFSLIILVVGFFMFSQFNFLRRRKVWQYLGLAVSLLIIYVSSNYSRVSLLELTTFVVIYVNSYLNHHKLLAADRAVEIAKPTNRLSEIHLGQLGLTELEEKYIVLIHLHRTVKDIAREFGVKETTVRNNLSRIYRKLGISGQNEFLRMVGTVCFIYKHHKEYNVQTSQHEEGLT